MGFGYQHWGPHRARASKHRALSSTWRPWKRKWPQFETPRLQLITSTKPLCQSPKHDGTSILSFSQYKLTVLLLCPPPRWLFPWCRGLEISIGSLMAIRQLSPKRAPVRAPNTQLNTNLSGLVLSPGLEPAWGRKLWRKARLLSVNSSAG